MSEVAPWQARARKYLATSASLIELGDYESSVSRSYYAMFFMATAALHSKDLAPRSHKGVLRLFAEHFVKPGLLSTDVLTNFRNAFDDRLLAEYDPDFSFSRSEAEMILAKAQSFVDHVQSLL